MRTVHITTLPLLMLAGALLVLAYSATASAHCQVPCGIYDDHMRIHMIEEDLSTIEKAMNKIKELEAAAPVNYNQVVRWVNTKEDHAQKIQDLVSVYFLAQRIKPDQPEYHTRLELLHKLITGAMKCKQTVDLEHVEAMRETLKAFEELYFTE